VALKTCQVSCRDLTGVEHSIEVSVGGAYEAVAQALKIFRDKIGSKISGAVRPPLRLR
jgi:hypothetical protein